MSTVISSSDTITWNNAGHDTTSLTMERTFIGSRNFVEAGAGATLGGLFDPSLEAESARGTR
ncbi:hypothetical protein ACFVX9_39725, partial [Kitasatospora sp. NPDC058243]|uniref:hypothetical protein n=1 Tax=Kitasatospora sp. NPDC058243 TaxID=3346397 RepID=UPI0036DB6A4A